MSEDPTINIVNGIIEMLSNRLPDVIRVINMSTSAITSLGAAMVALRSVAAQSNAQSNAPVQNYLEIPNKVLYEVKKPVSKFTLGQGLTVVLLGVGGFMAHAHKDAIRRWAEQLSHQQLLWIWQFIAKMVARACDNMLSIPKRIQAIFKGVDSKQNTKIQLKNPMPKQKRRKSTWPIGNLSASEQRKKKNE